MEKTTDVLQKVKTDESTIIMGHFNAHIEKDAVAWKGVIGQHGDADNKIMEDSYCNNGLCIMNTSFQQRFAQLHLMQRFTGSTATPLFQHNFS